LQFVEKDIISSIQGEAIGMLVASAFHSYFSRIYFYF